jgi:hypothetical protein
MRWSVVALIAAGLSLSACSTSSVTGPSSVLDAPADLISFSLDEAIELSWSSNARTAAPDLFSYYAVYSTSYDLDNGVCGSSWVLEGTTVSEDFIASGLTNGAPRCFAVSAINTSGIESDWSSSRYDTPRYDSRNVVVYAQQVSLARSGFKFYDPSSGYLGLVLSGDRNDLDFYVDRDVDGTMWLVPVRTGTEVAFYGTDPVADLTSIDVAPVNGFDVTAVEASPGYGYVFEMDEPDGLHFGGVRVTHVGQDFVILDWSYQSDPGNPELRVVAQR